MSTQRIAPGIAGVGGGTTPPPYIPGISRDTASVLPSIRRNHRTALAIWWREIDGVLLFLITVLMAVGALAVAAASPASARKLSDAKTHFGDMHYFVAHLRWQLLGMAVMLAISLLSKVQARRLGIVMGGLMLVALMLVPVIGTDHNGSKRWLLGTSFQPSEFLKPAFSVCVAWVLSWRLRDPRMPVMWITGILTAVVAALLMLQPDFGSTVLFAMVWFVMVLMCGLPVRRIAGVGVGGVFLVAAAYVFYGNARNRIDAFLGGGSAYDQVAIARRTLTGGGWTGTGLWLGTHKMTLPEAHTDYILSVVGEEFGLMACAFIVLLYLLIVVRVLRRLAQEDDLFTILAATGLVAQFGGQAFINILVNLQMFPSKGMTLPLISYGGSSTVALCLGIGFLLAITRRNPFLGRDNFTRLAMGEPVPARSLRSSIVPPARSGAPVRPAGPDGRAPTC